MLVMPFMVEELFDVEVVSMLLLVLRTGIGNVRACVKDEVRCIGGGLDDVVKLELPATNNISWPFNAGANGIGSGLLGCCIAFFRLL